MDYRKEYEKWLASPALSEAERAELEAIRGDEKEIEGRFYGSLVWHGFYDAALATDLGDEYFVARFPTEEEAIAFMDYVQE